MCCKISKDKQPWELYIIVLIYNSPLSSSAFFYISSYVTLEKQQQQKTSNNNKKKQPKNNATGACTTLEHLKKIIALEVFSRKGNCVTFLARSSI